MPSFRISKYDPDHRENGAYLRDEWTSVADIGKVFNDEVLTQTEYCTWEQKYLDILRRFIKWGAVDELRALDMESDDLDSDGPVEDSTKLSVEEAVLLAQKALREELWCRLEGPRGFFVHFGYDYYMYIGGDVLVGPPPLVEGLFVESCPSPYTHEEDGS